MNGSKMSFPLANKILETARQSDPEYAKKHPEPQKIMDEYVASIGVHQFIEDLTDRAMKNEVAKIIRCEMEYEWEDWPDLLTSDGRFIPFEIDKLAEWIIDSVVTTVAEG